MVDEPSSIPCKWEMTNRNLALLLTPVRPSPTGSGSAMRVGMVLEELARRMNVIVVHIPLWGERPGVDDGGWVSHHACAVLSVEPTRLTEVSTRLTPMISAWGGKERICLILAFRLVVAPIALHCKQLAACNATRTILDLDDDECSPEGDMRSLEYVSGDPDRLERQRQERDRMARFRTALMQRFDHVLLANPKECADLSRRHAELSLRVLPNAVRTLAAQAGYPVEANSLETPRDKDCMLFLGTLDYPPNEDAVFYFVHQILPLIRRSRPAMRLRVVGVGMPPAMLQLAEEPGVQLVGYVPETEPELRRAGMLVVPLRAGSGTRIKILEACLHGTPVVSTSKGAEGLSAENGEHLLIGDTPEEFSNACLRLSSDRELARDLSIRGRDWVVRDHGPEAIAGTLDVCLSSTPKQHG